MKGLKRMSEDGKGEVLYSKARGGAISYILSKSVRRGEDGMSETDGSVRVSHVSVGRRLSRSSHYLVNKWETQRRLMPEVGKDTRR